LLWQIYMCYVVYTLFFDETLHMRIPTPLSALSVHALPLSAALL